MANVTPNIANILQSQGAPTPVSILELQLLDGTVINIADAYISAPSILSPGTRVPFHAWLMSAPEFQLTATLATASADCTLGNFAGDTVNRKVTAYFTKHQLWGALFAFRLWYPAPEFAGLTVIGNVSDVPAVGDSVQLTLRGWGNYSEIKAPDGRIDNNSCLNVFGSQQCGSTSSTPCQNTYGTCTQLSRFKGVVPVWDGTALTQPIAIAQTVPNVELNLRSVA